MSRYGSQYAVGRPTGRCAATDRELAPGESIVATLVEREDGSLERLDYAAESWPEVDHGDHEPFSTWRTVVPDPGDRQTPFVDDDVLSDLFDRLGDDERPERISFRFVLALILIRKRRLRFTGRVADPGGGRGAWLVRRPGTDPEIPPIRVVDPGLGDDDVHELTAQLGEILQGEL